MADYEYDAYKRCAKFQNAYITSLSVNGESHPDTKHFEFIKDFCKMKPLMSAFNKRMIRKCIRLEQNPNQISISKFSPQCTLIWQEAVEKFKQEREQQYMMSSSLLDLDRSYSFYYHLKKGSLKDDVQQREKILSQLQKIRQLQCMYIHTNDPENAKIVEQCSQLKNDLFRFLSGTACHSVSTYAQNCLHQLTSINNKNVLYYLMRNWDYTTKFKKERECSNASTDVYECFEKYLLFLVEHPNLFDKNVDIMGRLKYMDTKFGGQVTDILAQEPQFKSLGSLQYDWNDSVGEREDEDEEDEELGNVTEWEERMAREAFERMKAKEIEQAYAAQKSS